MKAIRANADNACFPLLFAMSSSQIILAVNVTLRSLLLRDAIKERYECCSGQTYLECSKKADCIQAFYSIKCNLEDFVYFIFYLNKHHAAQLAVLPFYRFK